MFRLEIDLGKKGDIEFTFFKNMGKVATHTVAVADLTSELIGAKVGLLLRSGLGGR